MSQDGSSILQATKVPEDESGKTGGDVKEETCSAVLRAISTGPVEVTDDLIRLY